MTSIGAAAFADAPIQALVIGNGLSTTSSVGKGAFLNACLTLTSVSIDSPGALGRGSGYSDFWTSDADGVQIRRYQVYEGLHFGRTYPVIENATNYPDGIGCAVLESITLGDNVVTVGANSFSKLPALTSLTIGNSVTSIGDYAFNSPKSLTSVVIPDAVTSIGSHAFDGATSLTSVVIPDSVTSIGSYAFRNSGLISLTLGSSVTSINSYAFQGTALTSLTIPDAVTSIGSYAFDGATSLTSVVIPDSVTSIGSYAFRNSGLTSLTPVSYTHLRAHET